MRCKSVVMLLMGLLFYGMAAANSSIAAEIGTGTWLWEGLGNDIAYDVSIETIASNSFWLTNSSGTALRELIDSDTYAAKFTIIQSDGSYYAQFASANDRVLLGNDDKFGFTFSGENGYSSIYTLSSYLDRANQYVLTGLNGSMEILLKTSAQPSAVPIPGAAVLLGSSLLGLVGLGSRKKKNIMPVAA